MATLLLVVIYIAFIGLGIPDSLFGAAWPAVYADFAIPFSSGSLVTLACSLGTVAASLTSTRLIARFGTPAITAASTALTAAALLGQSFAPGLPWLCLIAIPLGLGGGAIDAALNNYVALHYSALHMNLLHCFYGVGVTVSPLFLAGLLASDAGWRGGYRVAAALQTVIALIAIAALPLWKRAHPDPADAAQEAPAVPLRLGQIARLPGIRAVWLCFISSCAIEYIVGCWGSTFLVEIRALTESDAARVITFYYFGMALGRFLSGMLSGRLSPWRLIFLGEGVLTAAVVVLILIPHPLATGGALFLIGLGNGPVFPNLTHLTPENFGRENSQAVIGTQMAAAYTSIMLMPVVFSLASALFGMRVFGPMTVLAFAALAAATVTAARICRK